MKIIVKYEILDPSNLTYAMFTEDGEFVTNPSRIHDEEIPLRGIASNYGWLTLDVHRFTDEIKEIFPDAEEIEYVLLEVPTSQWITTTTTTTTTTTNMKELNIKLFIGNCFIGALYNRSENNITVDCADFSCQDYFSGLYKSGYTERVRFELQNPHLDGDSLMLLMPDHPNTIIGEVEFDVISNVSSVDGTSSKFVMSVKALHLITFNKVYSL